MTNLIAYLVAIICVAAFVTIWFKTVYAELSAKRKCIAELSEQLRLHEGLYVQAKEGSDLQAANDMLETSRLLCREAAKNYNHILHKPKNYVPALFMGFRPVDEE